MATKVTHHCDMCDKQLSYVDGDGHQQVAGILVQGKLEFNVHQPRSSGYSSWACSPVDGGLFCSPECLKTHIKECLIDVERYKANG